VSKHIFAIFVAMMTISSSSASAQDMGDSPIEQFSMDHMYGDRHFGRPGGDMMSWHKEVCAEHYANRISHLAYIESKLDLTEQQRAAWNKYREARINAASQVRASCLENTPKAEGVPTIIEQEDRIEKFLSARLHGLQSSRDALQGLYTQLTTEQKTAFDQSAGQRRHHWRRNDHEE
jgi:periplasmic protein CpxP/Spy